MTEMMELTIRSGTGKKAKIDRFGCWKDWNKSITERCMVYRVHIRVVVGVWFGNDGLQ